MIGLFDLAKCVHMSITIAPPSPPPQPCPTKLLELELILPSFSLSFPVLHLPWPPSEERNPHESVVAQVFRAVRGWLRQLLDGRRCRVYKATAPFPRPPKEVWTGSRRKLASSSICRHCSWCEPSWKRSEENGGKQIHAITVRKKQPCSFLKKHLAFKRWINCKAREKWENSTLCTLCLFCKQNQNSFLKLELVESNGTWIFMFSVEYISIYI